MQGWRLGFLGIETIPSWLGEFEVEQFFRLSPSEISTVKTRRGNEMQLGLGLHIGFLRMSGRVLNSTDVIHWRILAFLGVQLQIPAPRVASLRALYPRRPTLHEHQQLAKAQLGFKNLIEPAQRQLVAHLRQTRGAATDATELLMGARQWLYEHRYLIPSDRHLLDICRAVLCDQEAKLVAEIEKIAPARQRKRWVTDEAKAWVISIACTKPKDHGLAAELWSISALARFVCEGAEPAGHPRLAQAGKSTVWRILNEHDIKPHKIRYYLERRDPEFDRKMQEVLLVYRDVSIYADGAVHDGRPNPIYTVSVDEKPGVQALGLTAPDLPPVPGKAATVTRDYEYVRHGTVSILAGIDLHSGHIFARTEDRHRSVEFIALLKDIDAYYPPEAIIRVVLDNHSAHISKETMAFLATRPGRFEYIHTPKHGSWLNLIECAFSKMARTFLRHIRVASLDELKTRILKGVDEMNQLPVVFRWNKFDIGIA